MKLTEHFALEEFTHSDTAEANGWDNTPTPKQIENLKHLAQVMEKVRHVLGDRPVRITSGFRSSRLNIAVGGVWNSAHLDGLACDFNCIGYGTVREVALAIVPYVKDWDIDQLIFEHATWVHLGLPASNARHEVFTINETGYHVGIV